MRNQNELVVKGKKKADFVTSTFLFLRSGRGKSIFTLAFVGIVASILMLGPGDVTQSSDASISVDVVSGTPQIDVSGMPGLKDYQPRVDRSDREKIRQLRSAHVNPKLTGPKLIGRSLAIEIPDGSQGSATLVTGAKSGPVKAKLGGAVKTRFGETLLPRDTILLGLAEQAQGRLMLTFHKAILPDGDEVKVAAIALDGSDETPGLKGSYLLRQGLLLAGQIGLNTLSGVADGLQENEAVGVGVARKATVRNAALNGTSRASLDQAKEITQSVHEGNRNLTASPGTEFAILFTSQN